MRLVLLFLSLVLLSTALQNTPLRRQVDIGPNDIRTMPCPSNPKETCFVSPSLPGGRDDMTTAYCMENPISEHCRSGLRKKSIEEFDVDEFLGGFRL